VTNSLNNREDAEANSQARVETLIEEGTAAIEEGRWEDADLIFRRAIVLAPLDPRVAAGMAAASARRKDAIVAVPDEEVVADEEFEARQIEQDELDALKSQLSDARLRMKNGLYGDALGLLKDLEKKSNERILEYQNGSRAPASLRDEFLEETRMLKDSIGTAFDQARGALLSEYQTQLADAEEHIANRQYVAAREVYDRILKTQPLLEEIKDLRSRLYKRIISEARSIYHEALIYESVGNINEAITSYQKTRDLLANVNTDPVGVEYRRKAQIKLRRLVP
jgi:tetratricopeptide (TPR) repeat protein